MTELTPELQQALDAAAKAPPELIDARTNERYVLVRSEEYERLQRLAGRTSAEGFDVPEGIRRCRAALARELPALLADRQSRGRWVVYHCGERVALGRDKAELVRECIRRGYQDDEYLVAKVTPGAAADDEEIDRTFVELDDEGVA